MRLFLLTTLVMISFAANSVLNRMALLDEGTGPAAFALVRLGTGALVLVALALLRSGNLKVFAAHRVYGVASLVLYVLGFSFAYVTLETGTGALILFGGVQITMFLAAVIHGEAVPKARWFGACVAFGGLIVLLWPKGAGIPDITGALLMAIAAVGWGMYSLLGRSARDPLAATAANFLLSVPIAGVVFLALPDSITLRGAALATISGAVASGAGYALWYRVLPKLATSVAAVSQLTVPLIAVAGGVLFLGEPVQVRFVVAAVLVLAGVVVSLRR